jgi:hypothetical protein
LVQIVPPSVVHCDSPTPHVVTHMPLTHDFPVMHAFPHAPQLTLFALVSTHKLPHLVVPPLQSAEHLPCEQTKLESHLVPQLPQ